MSIARRSLGAALATLVFARSAGADDSRLLVDQRGRAPVHVEVLRAWDDRVLATCGRALCTFDLPVGTYRLHVPDEDGVHERTATVRVTTAGTRYAVKLGSSAEADWGMFSALAGMGLIVGGFVGVWAARPSDGASCDATCRRDGTIGGAVMISGVALTVVGWILWADGRTKFEDLTPHVARASSPLAFAW